MVLVDCDEEVLIDTVQVFDGVLDAVPLGLWLADGVNETLADTVALIDSVELLVALSDGDSEAVTVPLVLSDSLRLTDEVLLALVLNEMEAVFDAVAVSLAVAVIDVLMLALDVMLDESLDDREVLQLTELLEDGDGVALWLMEGVLVALDDGDNVGDAEEVTVSLLVLDRLVVPVELYVLVDVMELELLTDAESVMDCDADDDKLLVIVLLFDVEGEMLTVDDKEPLSDQE